MAIGQCCSAGSDGNQQRMPVSAAGAGVPVATSSSRCWATAGMISSQLGKGSSSARKAGVITGVRNAAEPSR